MAPFLLRYRDGRLILRHEFPIRMSAKPKQQHQHGRLEQLRSGNANHLSSSYLHFQSSSYIHFQSTALITFSDTCEYPRERLWMPCKISTCSDACMHIYLDHQNADNAKHKLGLKPRTLSASNVDKPDHGTNCCFKRDHYNKRSSSNLNDSAYSSSFDSLRKEIVLQSFCKDGDLDGAFRILSDMDMAPSKSVYASILKLCVKKKSVGQVMKVLSHLLGQGAHLNGELGDHLVTALANCGAILDAHDLILRLALKNIHSWNVIIAIYVASVSAHDALHVHVQMQECGVQPDSYTFATLFKACCIVCDLRRGQELHLDAHKRGYTSNIFVENSIVTMYGKCYSVQEAENVFQDMFQHDVVSWNSMLSIYVQQNRGKLALLLYRQMLTEGEIADLRTVVFAIQACASLMTNTTFIDRKDQSVKVAAAQIGEALHADAAKKNFLSHVFVSTALCSLYAKVGLTYYSEKVFGSLSHRDIVSWNAMLSVYVEQGEGEKALQYFKQLQVERLNPNELTYVIGLKACSAIAEKDCSRSGDGCKSGKMALQIGFALHADAQGRDFVTGSFFGTGVLSMYSKCGAVLETEHLFCGMLARDTVSWNVLISMYVHEGQGEKALHLYRQMQEEAVHSDHHTLVSALRACGSLAESEEAILVDGQAIRLMPLDIGQALHAEAHNKGFTCYVHVSNTLLRLFGKCGTITEAENVFAVQPTHDNVSWNSMMTTYAQLGLAGKALQLYQRMLEEESMPDQLTFVVLLQACGILAEKEEIRSTSYAPKHLAWKIGEALHEDICKSGYESDVQVANTLISLYGKCGRMNEAELVFLNSIWRGVVTWTALLSAFVEQGQGGNALRAYGQMQGEGTSPNSLTYFMALQACGLVADEEDACFLNGRALKPKSLEIGEALHTEAVMMGHDLEIPIAVLLVTMFGKCGAILEAENIFFGLLPKDINLWNAILSIYVSQGQEEDAVGLYPKLTVENIIMDDVTYLSILQACSETGSLEVCSEIHFHLVSGGYDLIPSIATTIIHAYGSCASILEVDALLSGISSPDVVSWTACISFYTGEGNLNASEQVLETVKLSGLTPDGILFTSMISSCSCRGLAAEGMDYFLSMIQDYNIVVTVRHICTIVDLLGRAGNFRKAVDILKRMPKKDNSSFWLSLLGACRLHRNMELAKLVFNHAVMLHPEQGAAYVLLSNLYAQGEFQESVLTNEELID